MPHSHAAEILRRAKPIITRLIADENDVPPSAAIAEIYALLGPADEAAKSYPNLLELVSAVAAISRGTFTPDPPEAVAAIYNAMAATLEKPAVKT
jgi:hypothetical protein